MKTRTRKDFRVFDGSGQDPDTRVRFRLAARPVPGRVGRLAAAARGLLFLTFTIQHQRADAAFRRRGRSTKSAASSASLRSVLRDVPICARIVRPRVRSRT